MTTDRRSFVVGAGALVLAACSGSDEPAAEPEAGASSTTTSPADSASTTSSGAAPSDAAPGDDGLPALTVAAFEALPICVTARSSAAGPFPTVDQLERRDVTEGYAGHPLRLGIRVVDDRCEPVTGADVEIWHTDATGDYSAYDDGGDGKDEGEGTTFCRGFQTSDADGILEFWTIYPGWYPNRAVHIHVRVRIDDELVLTTQLYFDEDYTESVYEQPPYAEFGPPRTKWATDPLIDDPETDGSGITLASAPTPLGDGTLGLVNLGIPA